MDLHRLQTVAILTMADMITKSFVADATFQTVLDIVGPFNLDNGPWIAGGAIRKIYQGKNWLSGDIDIWCKTHEQLVEVTNRVKSIANIKNKHSTKHANTFVIPANMLRLSNGDSNNSPITLQIITRLSESLGQLFDTFDFTICRFATDGSTIYSTPRSIADCEDNRLTCDNLDNIICKVMRIIKYISYGFYPEPALIQYAIEYTRTNQTIFSLGGDNCEYQDTV